MVRYSVVLGVRLRREDFVVLERAAKVANISLSTWVRDAALAAAKKQKGKK